MRIEREYRQTRDGDSAFARRDNEKGKGDRGGSKAGGQHNADNEEEVSRACSDSDVSANDGTDAVDGETLINSPVDVLSEDLRLEARKVDRPVAKDVSDSRDTRYTAAVRCQPVDGRCRISSHYAVHSAAVHVREFHPRRRLRHEARSLHLVRGVATCNKPKQVS